jgi:hypothetical protein
MRLVRRTAALATPDPKLRRRAIERGRELVTARFSPGETIAPHLAAALQQVIREVTGNPDPYREMKDKEMELAAELFSRLLPGYGEDLRARVTFSVLGNTLDFFKDLDVLLKEMNQPVRFARDDIDQLARELPSDGKILFLADNAGEGWFDLPLIKKLEERAEVIYVVKEAPVQDDLTLADLTRAGLREKFPRLMTTGAATPGIDLSLVSEEFRHQLFSAPLVIAKGMAFYETLSEVRRGGRVFYLLRAKCPPVAAALGVPLNSYVARLE